MKLAISFQVIMHTKNVKSDAKKGALIHVGRGETQGERELVDLLN